jgi:tetratricopeptide (TPR) repeat protein
MQRTSRSNFDGVADTDGKRGPPPCMDRSQKRGRLAHRTSAEAAHLFAEVLGGCALQGSGFTHFEVESDTLEYLHVTLLPLRWWECIVPVAALLVFAASANPQTSASVSTVIPGIVEPLELTGEPRPFAEPTELEKRLAGILPQGNDPQALRKAKESVDVLIQEYPTSADALSSRLMFSCEIKAKDVPIKISDIDTVIQLQKSASTKAKLFSEPELRAMKAKIEYDSGDHKRAVEDLYFAITSDVPNADNLLNSGGVQPENKSEPCSWYKPDLDQLIKELPTDYRVYLFRGLYYLVFCRFGKAGELLEQPVLDFTRAATLNPKSPLPPYFLGKTYMSTLGVLFGTDADTPEKRTKALAAYDKAVQIDPHFTQGYAERAEIYYERKQYREAIKDYDRVIEADPKAGGAYNDRALAKSELNDSYSAISDFSSAIENKDTLAELNPKQTYENRADEYVKVENYDQAIQDYTQAIKLLIGEEIFLMNIAQVKRLYPEYKNVSDDALCRKLHEMFFRNMKYEDFEKQLTDPSRKDFDTFLIPDLLVKRGDTYLKTGDFRKAITDYQRATNGFAYGRKVVDRWHLAPKGPNGELYLDSQTAEFADSNSARFWLKDVDTRKTAKGTYTIEQYAVDCRMKRINMLSFLKYNSDGGNAIASSDVESGWQSIVPETLGEQLYVGMCH